MNTKLISDIEKHGKTARGRQELLKHLDGGRLTLKQSVLAHCFPAWGITQTENRIADCQSVRFSDSWPTTRTGKSNGGNS